MSDHDQDITERTEELPEDFLDEFSDIDMLMDGMGLDCFQFDVEMVGGYSSSFDTEQEVLDRAIEYVNTLGAGRGFAYEDHTFKRRYNTLEVYFSPPFESGEDLDQALRDEDGVI